MQSNSLWRTLPFGARMISLLPIVTFLIISAIFLYFFLYFLDDRRTGYKIYYLIGFFLWLVLASFIIMNLRSESTEKRPAGFLQIPPVSLIAFNVVVLGLNLLCIYYILTPFKLEFYFAFLFMGCAESAYTGLMMAWGISFSLGNLLLHFAYAEFSFLKGRLGILARHFSFLNGMVTLSVFTVIVVITFFIEFLCGGPV